MSNHRINRRGFLFSLASLTSLNILPKVSKIAASSMYGKFMGAGSTANMLLYDYISKYPKSLTDNKKLYSELRNDV